MRKTNLRAMFFFVGGHLLLGLILIITEAIHGVNDQDASFALALAVYYANWPTVWILNQSHLPPCAASIVLAGICQWTVVAIVLDSLWHAVTSKCREKSPARKLKPRLFVIAFCVFSTLLQSAADGNVATLTPELIEQAVVRVKRNDGSLLTDIEQEISKGRVDVPRELLPLFTSLLQDQDTRVQRLGLVGLYRFKDASSQQPLLKYVQRIDPRKLEAEQGTDPHREPEYSRTMLNAATAVLLLGEVADESVIPFLESLDGVHDLKLEWTGEVAQRAVMKVKNRLGQRQAVVEDTNKRQQPTRNSGVNIRELNPPARLTGCLGKPLGTRTIVGGILAERVMLANPLRVSDIDGQWLKDVVNIEIRGGPHIQEGVHYRLEGYEAGEFSGPPTWLSPLVQQPFQYRSFFMVTNVIEPD